MCERRSSRVPDTNAIPKVNMTNGLTYCARPQFSLYEFSHEATPGYKTGIVMSRPNRIAVASLIDTLPLILLVLFTTLVSSTENDAAERNEKPNVVLIYIDDLGYGDLGAYGCTDIPTPNIDQLAKEGVRCTASYITNPPCCPSRCSLMMGQYGQRFGKYGMSRGLPIPDDRPTLAGFLQDQGYVTGQIGKWDIGTKRQGPLKVGFTEVAKIPPKKQYSSEELAAASAALRRQIAKKNGHSKYFCINGDGETVWLTDYDGDSMVNFIDRHKTEPFFLYWSPEAVHSFNTEVPSRLIDRTRAKGKRQKLAGAIVSVDDQVGKLLRVLNKHGLRQNTLVIFTSDNGPNLDEGGTSTPYQGGKGKGKRGGLRVIYYWDTKTESFYML